MTHEASAASDLRARVLAEAARTPSPTRAVFKRRVLVIAGIGALATASLFLAMGGMRPGTRPVEMIGFTAGFGLMAAAILTRLSSTGHGPMLGRPRSVLLTAVVVTAPLLALAALGATMAWPESAVDEAGARATVACGLMSVAQGILPLLALLLPRRGTDPVHPAVTGAALGMTAGAWTAAMAYLRCPHTGAMHCILAHVVPTLVLTAIGAALGWLVLRVK